MLNNRYLEPSDVLIDAAISFSNSRQPAHSINCLLFAGNWFHKCSKGRLRHVNSQAGGTLDITAAHHRDQRHRTGGDLLYRLLYSRDEARLGTMSAVMRLVDDILIRPKRFGDEMVGRAVAGYNWTPSA